MAELTKERAREILWRRGELGYLMTTTQRQALHMIRSGSSRYYLLRCTRRYGKTFLLAILAYMVAIAKPGALIRYVAPSKLAGRQFVRPAFDWVASRAPEWAKPRFNTMDNCWKWPNGSICYLGSAETMRDVEAMVGTACDLALVDECGKYTTGFLTHLIKSVLRPQFLTTKGITVMASTPPISRAHDFTAWSAEAMERGCMARYTIDDIDHVPDEEKALLIADNGGIDAPEVRRELYCEDVIDIERAVVPEFAKAREHIVRPAKPPRFRKTYTVADFGFNDLTAVLFAYHDFERAKVVIEDELVFRFKSGLEVGRAVLAKEQELWGHENKPRRYADAPAQLLADLSHPTLGPGISFAPCIKEGAESALNVMRMAVGRHEVEIDPKCVTLLAHLEFATWNLMRTSYDRHEDHGHWDMIDALKYTVRHVARNHNPEPHLLPEHVGRQDVLLPPRRVQPSSLAHALNRGRA